MSWTRTSSASLRKTDRTRRPASRVPEARRLPTRWRRRSRPRAARRRNRSGRRFACGEADRHDVALCKRTALQPAEARANMRAPRSQHARKIDAALERQIGPRAAPAALLSARTSPAFACMHHHGGTVEPASTALQSTPVSANAACLHRSAGGTERSGSRCRRIAVIAEQRVAGRERDRIHGARRAHAEAARADTPQILYGIERVAGQYLDHNSIRSILNLTRSPGAISDG